MNAAPFEVECRENFAADATPIRHCARYGQGIFSTIISQTSRPLPCSIALAL
jgi:hypothetical protein